MSRKEARDRVFKLVYEKSVAGELNELSFSIMTQDCEGDDLEYIKTTCLGINDYWEFLERVIERYSIEYRVERVYRIDFSLIAIAIYEILFIDSIPFQVSVNEAVELSKKYSTEKSYKFVNGILSSIIKDKNELLAEFNKKKD